MFCAFDLETAELVSKENGPGSGLGITCAGLYLETGATQIFKPTRVLKGTKYPGRMSPVDCQIVAKALLSYADHGWDVISWNGLKFDFHVLAVECQNDDWYRRTAAVALNHIDMMFAFYCHRGFFLKLVKATEAMGLGGKTEGVDGVKAVELWKGSLEDQELVLKYAGRDARITGRLYEKALRERQLRWRNSKGGISTWYLPTAEIPDVQMALRSPLPNTSWMDRKPVPREEFYAWTDGAG